MSYSPGTAEQSPSNGDLLVAAGQREFVSDESRRDAGLSHPDLWLRYFALGGMSTSEEVESHLCHRSVPSTRDHDVIAQVLNERFSELGGKYSRTTLLSESAEGLR